jgi:hypothetical protein
MADRQKLKLTLRNIASDRTWTNQPLTIDADPDDTDNLREHGVQMACDLDGRSSGNLWWADQYKVHVEGIDQTWWNFWISVGGR